MTVVLNGVDGVKARVGQEIGVGPWMEIDQARIDRFAEATGDHQWIHVDAERARQGPFGRTIAHGLLTLSMGPALVESVLRIEGFRLSLNYGYDRVRFTAPVPVDSRVRARVALAGVEDIPGGVQIMTQVTVELEGSDKPACVFTSISRRMV